MGQQVTAYKKNLAIRDGEECFYCAEQLPKEKLTVEHILSLVDGGSHHRNNFCLACLSCNRAVRGMPITYKIKYREKMRGLVELPIT